MQARRAMPSPPPGNECKPPGVLSVSSLAPSFSETKDFAGLRRHEELAAADADSIENGYIFDRHFVKWFAIFR